jgi:tetratricopeptide (TPR) repeat protein
MGNEYKEKACARKVPDKNMKRMATTLLLALIIVTAPGRCLAAAPAAQTDATSTSTSLEKPNSQGGGKLHALGVAREDSAYRYLAEKGAELFRAGRFGEAERYYRAALTNAENDGIHDRRLAMLVTNLATDLRQQQKYEESETLFERAVEIERRLKQKDEELMVYTAKQYAALLRETARDASGDAVIASAHNNFAMLPKIKGVDVSNENSQSDDETETMTTVVEGRKISKKNPERNTNDLFATRTELTPTPPPAQLGVMAELKMLADIEQGYMYGSDSQSQYLPSSFSYLNSTPLYSSPGLTGAYVGGFGGYGVYSGYGGSGFGYGGGYGGGFHSHGGWHSGRGGGGGGHR